MSEITGRWGDEDSSSDEEVVVVRQAPPPAAALAPPTTTSNTSSLSQEVTTRKPSQPMAWKTHQHHPPSTETNYSPPLSGRGQGGGFRAGRTGGTPAGGRHSVAGGRGITTSTSSSKGSTTSSLQQPQQHHHRQHQPDWKTQAKQQNILSSSVSPVDGNSWMAQRRAKQEEQKQAELKRKEEKRNAQVQALSKAVQEIRITTNNNATESSSPLPTKRPLFSSLQAAVSKEDGLHVVHADGKKTFHPNKTVTTPKTAVQTHEMLPDGKVKLSRKKKDKEKPSHTNKPGRGSSGGGSGRGGRQGRAPAKARGRGGTHATHIEIE